MLSSFKDCRISVQLPDFTKAGADWNLRQSQADSLVWVRRRCDNIHRLLGDEFSLTIFRPKDRIWGRKCRNSNGLAVGEKHCHSGDWAVQAAKTDNLLNGDAVRTNVVPHNHDPDPLIHVESETQPTNS
jgi:hypothetical protein